MAEMEEMKTDMEEMKIDMAGLREMVGNLQGNQILVVHFGEKKQEAATDDTRKEV